ncbi:MAG: hypothetical protein LBS96_06755 [Oscillospiraceae bacterium]|jgi:hypothetical protein|nr:hypothetical protein [Oscillospiraceae bacterium]
MRFPRKLFPICVLTACVLLIASVNLRHPPTLRPLPQQSEIFQSSPYRYILKEEAGELAVFVVERGVPTRIASFPYMEETLPEQDRLDLKTGIALESAEQLQRALEDYLPEQY